MLHLLTCAEDVEKTFDNTSESASVVEKTVCKMKAIIEETCKKNEAIKLDLHTDDIPSIVNSAKEQISDSEWAQEARKDENCAELFKELYCQAFKKLNITKFENMDMKKNLLTLKSKFREALAIKAEEQNESLEGCPESYTSTKLIY